MMGAKRGLLVLLLVLGGCAKQLERQITKPGDARSLDHGSPYLKAHMKDGSLYLLSHWQVDAADTVVSGDGERRDIDRNVVKTGHFELRIDDVALFETNVVKNSPRVTALAIVFGVSAVITVACLSNPKACFGSCPTFYVSDGKRPVLMAEGFSDSIAPSLEATDLDALYNARPAGRDLTVTMTNEALETHVVRHVHVLAAPRPPGGRVFATADGELIASPGQTAATRCDAGGQDCLAAVASLDGVERFSATDGSDLAAREVIDLEFPAGSGRRGLVIGARQTLLSTFLFYQALAFMGRDAGERLADLERNPDAFGKQLQALRDALGGIEVQVPGGSGWQTAGTVRETGPLATDVHLVPLPELGPGPVHLRVRLTRGHWRLDLLSLATLGRAVTPVRLTPTLVTTRGTARDPGAGMTTLPGDRYDFHFRLPGEPAGYELFLESRGYYLEWMREQWLREESPLEAALLLLSPESALRSLAPAFKQREAVMERDFWSSRFRTRDQATLPEAGR